MEVELAAGIDVSHYKKRVDWMQVKESGVSFAFIKATEADNFVDSRFDYNWTRTRREGIIRGAYHFFRPLVDPVLQAQNFLKIVGPVLHRTDLPPVLDVEVYPDFVEAEYKRISEQERIQRIQVWLQTIEKATGKIPIIYTEYYTWFDFIGDTERFVRNPLWIANFRVDKPKVPANNWGGRGWTFWQTTERGIVPGIREEAPCVDLDIYRSSLEDLHAWLGIKEERPLPPDVTNGDMMAALIDAAEQMGASTNEWVARTGLSYLVDPVGNSLRPYDGPAVADLPLEAEEKKVLQEAMAQYEGKNASAWSITHQDMINAFYYAASLEDIGGWSLVERAGLGYIGLERDQLYVGPVIAELTGLTAKQKEAIAAFLGVGILTKPQEILDEPELEAEDDEQENVLEASTETEEEQTPEDETEAPEVIEETPAAGGVKPQSPTYGEEMNNQAVINAFYLAAIKLDINGLELISSADLEGLSQQRNAVYTGPKVEDLPGLTLEQKNVIAGLLHVELPEELVLVEISVEDSLPVDDDQPDEDSIPLEEIEQEEVEQSQVEEQDESPEEPSLEGQFTEEEEEPPTYLGLVNQDIIDLFYRVAAFFNENGWDWILRVGLGHLGENRKVRYKMYKGPNIEQISGLSSEQKKQLLKMFETFRQ